MTKQQAKMFLNQYPDEQIQDDRLLRAMSVLVEPTVDIVALNENTDNILDSLYFQYTQEHI